MPILPQFGFAELVLLAILALIVVGPQDLPRLARGLGRVLARLKYMAQDFRRAFDAMGVETELQDLRKEVERLKHETIEDRIDIDKDLRRVERDYSVLSYTEDDVPLHKRGEGETSLSGEQEPHRQDQQEPPDKPDMKEKNSLPASLTKTEPS